MYPQTLTLSSVGQITIPKNVRKLLGLEKGSKLNLEVDEKTNTIALRRQKTFDEIMAEMDEIDKKYHTPKPDPRLRRMTVSEMVEEELRTNPPKGDTWV